MDDDEEMVIWSVLRSNFFKERKTCTKTSLIALSFLQLLLLIFCVCLRPFLDHEQGDNHTDVVFFLCVDLFWFEGHGEPRCEIQVQGPTVWFRMLKKKPNQTSWQKLVQICNLRYNIGE